MVRDYQKDKANRYAKAARRYSSSLDSFVIRPAPAPAANQAAAGEGTEAEAEAVEDNAQGANAAGDNGGSGGDETANDAQSAAASDVGADDAVDEDDLEDEVMPTLPDVVYSSSLHRAVSTSQMIVHALGKTTNSIRIEDGLIEWLTYSRAKNT